MRLDVFRYDYRETTKCADELKWNDLLVWERVCVYRLHKLKHLPLLDFLHFKHVLQWHLVEMLPHVIHLIVCLGDSEETQKADNYYYTNYNN